MDDDKDSETVESDDVGEDKPRLEPTGMDEQPEKDEQGSEEKAQDDAELDCLAIFAQQLSNKDRLTLFEKGVRFKRKGSPNHALQCLLCCLQGLKERDQFTALPECLHYIAEIYSEQDDYETAIQFAQAEKLYYETALITINRDEKPEPWGGIPFRKPSDDSTDEDTFSQDLNFARASTSDEAQKADEYEKLAHMCLKQKNPQLALDYCAKAVKLHQACHGDQHPITLQTLDLFTLIYAEMGKQQYKAAMQKFAEAQEKEQQAKEPQKQVVTESKTEEELEQSEDKPVDVVEDEDEMKKADVGDVEDVGEVEDKPDDVQDSTDIPTTDDTVQVTLTSTWAMVLYFLITVLIGLLLTAILCYFTQTDVSSTLNYMTTRMKFYYYYYFVKNKPNGHVYF